jgi:hypothetical protein
MSAVGFHEKEVTRFDRRLISEIAILRQRSEDGTGDRIALRHLRRP